MNRNNNVLLLGYPLRHPMCDVTPLSGRISIYLAAWTALNWTTGLSLVAFCNMKCKFQKIKKNSI